MKFKTNPSGFGVVEAIVAVAIFGIIAFAGISNIGSAPIFNRLSDDNNQANLLSQEGIEAVRSLKKKSWSNLVAGNYGVGISSSTWVFSGTSQTIGKFTRTVNLATVSRDIGGSIVASGGTLDPDTFLVTSTVNWNFSPARQNDVVLQSYLTNWEQNISSGSTGGMVVYGNGATATDAMTYRLFDGSAWGIASSMTDVDVGTSNRALRAVRLYNSPTRNEKIAISRHFNGSVQYIYSQVFNGSTWGNVSVGSSWSATTFQDVQNFDGAYLNNGDFVMVYSNNTNFPLFKVWNGSVWGTGTSMPTIGGIPTYINTENRPGTNEVMASFFDQASDVNTRYFNGGTYTGANWGSLTEHATTAPLTTKRFVDFAWASSDSTQGVLIYTNSTTDKSMTMRTVTIGAGGTNSWGTASKYGTNQVSKVGAMYIIPVPGSSNFVACDKDANASPRIICSRLSTSGWAASSDVTVANAGDNGIQQSSALSFENPSSALGVVVYSDSSAIAKYKTFTVATNTWSSSPTNVNATVGMVKTMRAIPNTSNDIMYLVGDTNLDFYSIIWDGTNNVFYSSPIGKAWTSQGLNGSAITDYWYDFVWN